MQHVRRFRIAVGGTVLAAGLAWLLAGGCGGGIPIGEYGTPFTRTGGTTSDGTGSGGNAGVGRGGGSGSGADRTPTSPCAETESRKFIRVSMRNEAQNDYIHYFLVFIAFEYDATGTSGYTRGVVCPEDRSLYISNGYTLEIPAGSQQAFGNFCIEGPALIRYHESGRFRQPGAVSQLASAIAPAQGTQPSYDSFFTSAGALVPVPNLILFHNPGTGEGQALKISNNDTTPCDTSTGGGDAACLQDAFYYVTENDQLAGSRGIGINSGRRVPAEMQDTGCQEGLTSTGPLTPQSVGPFYVVAPPGVDANNALTYEFIRGGRIDFAFIRDDQNPPIPQLLWEVTDNRGRLVHEFDARAGID